MAKKQSGLVPGLPQTDLIVNNTKHKHTLVNTVGDL